MTATNVTDWLMFDVSCTIFLCKLFLYEINFALQKRW